MHAQDDGLANVLTAKRPDLDRLPGQIRAGGIQLFTDQGVVARRHEERELVVGVRSGDLYGAGARAGFGQQQRLRQSSDPMKKFAAGFFRSMMPSTAAV